MTFEIVDTDRFNARRRQWQIRNPQPVAPVVPVVDFSDMTDDVSNENMGDMWDDVRGELCAN